MIALVQRGLLDRRRAIVLWSLSIGAIGALYMFIWPSVHESIGQVIERYPSALKQAFGIGSLSTPQEFLNAEQFSLILPLALAFLALRGIAASIDGAQERGYLDVLLSAPVSRRSLVGSTVVVVAIEVATILFVSWALTSIASVIAGAHLSIGLAAAGYASVWPLALLAAGIATLVTGLSRHSASVTGISAAAMVAMYVLDLVGRLADSIEAVRWASVFRYYGAQATDGFDPLAFAGITGVALALTALGTILLERRDLAS